MSVLEPEPDDEHKEPTHTLSESDLVPIHDDDPIDASKRAVADAQDRIQQYMDRLDSGADLALLWSKAKVAQEKAKAAGELGRAAEAVARAQSHLADASVAREESARQDREQAHRHQLETEAATHQREVDRAKQRDAALEKLNKSLELLTQANASRVQVKMVLERIMALLPEETAG